MAQRSPALTEAISALLGKHPFFAVLMFDLLEIRETGALPTAGTDGRHLFINPKFFGSKSIQERIFILAHEILHVVMQHPSRMKGYMDRGFGPDLNPWSQSKFNRAADYVINRKLCDDSIGKMPMDALYHPDITANDLVDEVYLKLPDEPPKNGNGNGNGNGPSGGDEWDQHMSGNGQPQHDPAAIQRALKGAAAAAKAQGKLPAGMQRLVDEICEPQVSWPDKIRKVFTTMVGSEASTWRRPNKRKLAVAPHVYFPGRTGLRSGPLAVEIDTSGSVSPQELTAFLSELHGILTDVRPEKIYVMFVDAALYNNEVIEIDDPNDLLALTQKIGGGGGTDMEVVFREIEDRQLQVDHCIVFTDGYCNFGEERPIPTIWCITSDKRSPWGETVNIKIPTTKAA